MSTHLFDFHQATERAKYDHIFDGLQPINGMLTGDKVRPVSWFCFFWNFCHSQLQHWIFFWKQFESAPTWSYCVKHARHGLLIKLLCSWKSDIKAVQINLWNGPSALNVSSERQSGIDKVGQVSGQPQEDPNHSPFMSLPKHCCVLTGLCRVTVVIHQSL